MTNRNFPVTTSPAGQRDQWRGKWHFLCAVASYAIGLGALWRFPFLVYRNGGLAFLIPYVINIFLVGLPLWIVETGVGQQHQTGGLTVWKRINPLFKGIGYGTLTLAFLINTYYVIVLAWAAYYWWLAIAETGWTETGLFGNGSRSSVEQFWKNEVLGVTHSTSINEAGSLNTHLVLTLLATWALVFLVLHRGTRSIGPAVYAAASLPYALLALLLLRGLTLPGASEGITRYLRPDMSHLLNPKAWFDATTQVLFGYGAGLGALTAMGSYNHVKTNYKRQLCLTAGIHTATALIAGLVAFAFIGYAAQLEGVPIETLYLSGSRLAFITLPHALATLSPIWAILMFSLLFILGFGSQFVTVEGFVTAVLDKVESKRRIWWVGGTCLVSFLIGLSMVTQGGFYIFSIFDYYGASASSIAFFAILQCLVTAFSNPDMEEITGTPLGPFFRICIKYLTPLAMLKTAIYGLWRFENIRPQTQYPDWSIAFGWTLLVIPILMVPFAAGHEMIKKKVEAEKDQKLVLA